MQFSLALANIAHSFNKLALPVEEKQITILIDSGEFFSNGVFLMEKHKLLSLGSNFGLQI